MENVTNLIHTQKRSIEMFQQRKVSCGVTGPEKEKEIVLEAERLEIKEKAPMVLAELLFDANMAQQIRQYRTLFFRVSLF